MPAFEECQSPAECSSGWNQQRKHVTQWTLSCRKLGISAELREGVSYVTTVNVSRGGT